MINYKLGNKLHRIHLEVAPRRNEFLLEVVLKCNVEVKGVSSVSKADAYERTAA